MRQLTRRSVTADVCCTRVAFTWDTGYHLSPLWSHWFPVIILQQIPLQWHLNMLICFKICGGQPQACSLHTPPGGPELPSTEQSPHGRTACPPKGLSWAGGNTGGGSVCAWQRRQYTFKGFYHSLRDIFCFFSGSKTRKRNTYKRREMSLTKNLTLKKRTKVVVGTFLQLSGATLEILVSLSTKKNSLSEEETEKLWVVIYLRKTTVFWCVYVFPTGCKLHQGMWTSVDPTTWLLHAHYVF